MQDSTFQILMVEDVQRYHQFFATEIHDALNAEVGFATSGEEALDLLNSNPSKIDLLILDLNLPGMRGDEVLRLLRENPAFDEMPIIILTGESDPNLQSHLFGLGANEFIEKGSAPEVFVARLKAQVRHKRTLTRLTQLAVDREMFAAGVLHDIRNIETNLMAACELIEMQLRGEHPEQKIDTVLEDVASLKQQVKRMDDYATSIIKRVRAETTGMRKEKVDWNEVLDWSQIFVTGSKKGIKVESTPNEILPVIADEHFLKLATLNIFQNAIKYSSEGSDPRVLVSQTTDKGQITTKLRDYGQGVPKSDLRKIFEPFYRANQQTEANNSYGLGLAMVSNVITSMGGSVWAELPDDGAPGTVFSIELPASPQA